MLSDQRTVALVNPFGRIVWMCMPRIDSPAAFAELIGFKYLGAYIAFMDSSVNIKPKLWQQAKRAFIAGLDD